MASMNEPGELESVNKSVRILQVLKEREGAGVTELANHLDWPKSTVHAHLKTLKNNELIIHEDGEYDLGLRFLDYGEYVKHRREIYSLIEPKIEQLAEKVGERVQFVVNEHGEVVFVRIATGDRAVSTGSRLGRRRRMLHATAAGKSILAFLPDDHVHRIIEKKGLPKLTANTITDEEELFETLREIRERGYAFNDEEHIEGLRAVAAPVKDDAGQIVGSLSVAGPAHRLRGERFTEELPNEILGIRNELELDIKYR